MIIICFLSGHILFIFVAIESIFNLFCNSTYSFWIDHNRSQLLARCSRLSNNISVIDLETKKYYAYFQGVNSRIGATIPEEEIYNNWTHLKEISNTSLLVSLHHCFHKSTSLEIFDTSQVRKVYSIEESLGSNYQFINFK